MVDPANTLIDARVLLFVAPQPVTTAQLATALDVDSSNDEITAESRLGDVGIAPANGWIADYPVTPDILDEVRQSLIAAADDGKVTISKDEVLIRQHATSVNPIDFRMRTGYGRVIFSKKRGFELPLVLGRDVAGEVVKVGSKVKNLSVGDFVFGISATKAQGAYAEYVVSKAHEVTKKPASITFTEAAAIPYVACTVWDALVSKAGLTAENARGKKVFVQGGAGGIGSVAIQMLKAWGAYVATTCSEQQMISVRGLGADQIIDYGREDYSAKLSNFDVALETVGGALEDKTLSILRKDGKGKFVTLIHPLLKTFDDAGLLVGAVKNLRH